MKKSMTELIYEKYYTEIGENSGKIDIDMAKGLKDYECYFYDELPNIEVKGFPVGSDLVDKDGNSYDMLEHEALPLEIKRSCRLRYHYLPLAHEFYIGTTGSGKTTGCVEPQIRAIANQKNKPNIFITDPKGEIFNHNGKFLQEQGYNTFVLNFKDIKRTDKWNPISEIYEKYHELDELTGEAELIVEDYKPNSAYILQSNAEPNGYYYKFKNNIFSNLDDFNSFINTQRDLITSETDSLIRQFSNVFIPVKNSKDPSWEQGAVNVVEGILLLMLDLSVDKASGFTKDMFNIKTIFEIYNHLANTFVYTSNAPALEDYSLTKGHIKANKKLRVAFANTDRTARNYVGVFDTSTNQWRNGHIYSLTTGDTIDISDKSKPFAIFVITRDYEKSDFTIAGLFIDYIYRQLITANEEIMKSGGTPRPTHMLLDEFGNIPKIENFENKIATSRSRNIWMHLFLQSYEQIEFIYDEKPADIILSNCNNHIFLGSQSFKSIDRFSKECGRKSTPSLGADFNLSPTPMESQVLKFSDLDLIDPGSMYIKRLYSPVMYTHYIRSYYLNDNNYYNSFTKDSLIKCIPLNNAAYTDSKFSFKLDKYKEEDDNPFNFF